MKPCILTTRNRKRKSSSSAGTVPNRDEQLVNQSASQYHMRLSQNWKVEQLGSEFAKISVSFRKADKKAGLIQLCNKRIWMTCYRQSLGTTSFPESVQYLNTEADS